MRNASASLNIWPAAAVILIISTGHGSACGTSRGSLQQWTGRETADAALVIAAIRDEKTSIIQGAPKCEDGTTLRGPLVMETPQRVGFPFSATTFSSPQGTFTTITGAGHQSEAVIQEVAKALNNRADTYVERLLRRCSL